MNTGLFRYVGSGLSNVWLKNGYEEYEGKHGRTVVIHNIDGLHDAIGMSLIENSQALTGEQFRFLRKELDLSQSVVAMMLGVEEQTVSLWERKKDKPVQKGAELLIRALYKEAKSGSVAVKDMVDRLAKLDREILAARLVLADLNGVWEELPEAA